MSHLLRSLIIAPWLGLLPLAGPTSRRRHSFAVLRRMGLLTQWRRVRAESAEVGLVLGEPMLDVRPGQWPGKQIALGEIAADVA
jgi:hypothetical protein